MRAEFVWPRLSSPVRRRQVISRSKTLQGVAGGEDRDTPDFFQRKYMFLVTGDDEVGPAGNGRGQNRVVRGVVREVHARQLMKNESARVDVSDDGFRFSVTNKPP